MKIPMDELTILYVFTEFSQKKREEYVSGEAPEDESYYKGYHDAIKELRSEFFKICNKARREYYKDLLRKNKILLDEDNYFLDFD